MYNDNHNDIYNNNNNNNNNNIIIIIIIIIINQFDLSLSNVKSDHWSN